MLQKLHLLRVAVQHRIHHWHHEAALLVSRYWLRAFFIGLGVFLLIRKDVSINLNLNAAAASSPVFQSGVTPITSSDEEVKPMNVSLLSSKKATATPVATPPAVKRPAKSGDPNLSNTYSNVTKYDDETAAKRAAKRRKQLAYVDRYAKVAQAEMEKYGIPASITLAQGLLESNVGESRLATKNNNHFGIKCFSRRCKKGHCSNFTDDSHKDFFRKYKSAWESFRAHSRLLGAKRYKALYTLERSDYRGWAHGLKKAGYATDPNYAVKIIGLIEDLGLDQYDR